MAINSVSTGIVGVAIGDTNLVQVMLGTDEIWSPVSLGDDFNRSDSLGLGSNWHDHGSSTTPRLASVQGGLCRMNSVPSAITISFRASSWRYTADTSLADDGWIEVIPADFGSGTGPTPEYPTRILRRLTNAAFTDGVGIEIARGLVRITRLLSGTYTARTECGSYIPGDIIRLTQTADYHELTLNGEVRGSWNDSGSSAHKGSGYLSIGVAPTLECDSAGRTWRGPAIDSVKFS